MTKDIYLINFLDVQIISSHREFNNIIVNNLIKCNHLKFWEKQ
jgi:hypothetical protein